MPALLRSRFLILLVALVVVVVGAVVLVSQLSGSSEDKSSAAVKPDTASAPAALSAFYDQKLSWTDCGSARCTWVKVPIDYEKPDGATLRLRVKDYPATGGGATQSMFVNPGGPGGSAIDYADTMSKEFGKDVRAKYDVVGVDPRGVGLSTPLKCLSDKRFDAFSESDPDPDTPAEVKAFEAGTTELGDACLKNSGELTGHVSTEEAARDMDVVRALLGRKKMDWFGASYGTQLGATYAQIFPKTVGRMVLDGAVDPSQTVVEASLGQATGFQRALDDYAADCVKQASCPLGTNVKAGLAKISALVNSLDRDPMKTSSDRKLTEGQAFYGIAVTLYDKTTWSYLSQGLKQAFAGDGSTLLALSDAYFERKTNGTYNGNLAQVIYAVNCADSAERPTVKQTEAVLPQFEKVSPVFGRTLGWSVLGCTGWPVMATHPQLKISADGAPPILVLGTTRDPATPYESAQALAKQLSSGVLVTRVGDGHTAYSSGNSCITTTVNDYFLKGTVPDKGLVCK